MQKYLYALTFLLLGGYAGYAQCNLQYNWAVTSPGTNTQDITFTDNGSVYPSGPNLYYEFALNYGDGNMDIWTTSTPIPTSHNHIYAASGNYPAYAAIFVYDSSSFTAICVDTSFMNVTAAASACSTTITTVSNGNGSFDFTALSINGSSGMTYTWDFGDGNTGTGDQVSHTYTSGGTYTVIVSVNGTAGGGCSYVVTALVTTTGVINCSSMTPAFYYNNNNGLDVLFSNTTQAPMGLANLTSWDFGDGTTGSSSNLLHSYAAAGTYTVKMINTWVDTANLNPICIDSTSQTVTLITSYIQGYVFYDTTLYLNQPYFQVWLIEYNAANNTLTAVDSQIANIYNQFHFANPAAGSYWVKAAPIGGVAATPGFGLVPTYHDSSLYWNQATAVIYTSGGVNHTAIWMQEGTPVAGPGFIGGNISQGANKGSSSGVAGILVYLRNASDNRLIKAVYTDVNGDYSFGNIPAGTYTVYPEAMNYTTTPSAAITIVNGQSIIDNIDFTQTSNEILPVITSVGHAPVASRLHISPNPVQNSLYISGEINDRTNVILTDISGRTLPVRQVSAENGRWIIDVSNIPSGMYFIRVQTATRQFTEKIIIQH